MFQSLKGFEVDFDDQQTLFSCRINLVFQSLKGFEVDFDPRSYGFHWDLNRCFNP